jgi:PAS domain S-box-containing protein
MASSNHQPASGTPGPNDGDAGVYRLLVESVPDYAIFMLDTGGHIRTWSPGAERLKGYRADEIIGRHFSQFYPPERIAERWPEHELERALATGRFEDEGWRVRKDGTWFWANVVITALHDATGRHVGFGKVTRDLTVRRQQEEELRRSEQRFRLLVEGVRDYAIFMLDPHGRVASWNAGAQAIKGYTAAEIIGKHFSVFYPPDSVATGWPDLELELALRDGRLEDEGWRVRKDGSRFWASVVITALHDSTGRHIGFAKVTRDLTERRRVRALEDEGRRLTTFLAMLGHELRNPLAPIANAVSIMQLEDIPSERVRMCRDVIARQAAQLTRLVDDLLDVGRITTGKIRLERRPVELGALVAEAVEAAEPLTNRRSHRVDVDLPASPLWVHGDRVRLLQVLENLLNNAAKFTPPGGRIAVAVRTAAGRAEISVADNGPGIEPHRLPDIFNLFVQGEQDAAHVHGGLGLGLSLVQQLATLHGGDVSVFSTGEPGKGAEFVVRLPLIAPSNEAANDDQPPVAQRARRILVVDDNRDAADTLATLLQQLGYGTDVLYGGATVLEAVRAIGPDAVFLDLGLPDVDGLEVARRVRAELPAAPVLVAVTGYGRDADRQAALDAGFDLHLRKPLTAAILGSVLGRLFA